MLLRAQDVTGSINGVVKDPSGAVAQGIQVTVTSLGTGAVFHATADETGAYFVRGLAPGVYTLSMQAQGFKQFSANNIRVQVNEAVRMDIALQVGSVSQTVDVSGSVETVDTTSPTLENVAPREAPVSEQT